MEDHNRAAELPREDPLVMYLVVRKSLNMSGGKTAAQCAHAAQMLTMRYYELKETSSKLQRSFRDNKDVPVPADVMAAYKAMAPKISIFGEWVAAAIRKVVLEADEKEWAKLKAEIKDSEHAKVVDAGYTELEPGTETVIGLWPIRKSQASKTVRRLQALK